MIPNPIRRALSLIIALACSAVPVLAEELSGQWATIVKVTDGDTVWAIPEGADTRVKYRLRDFDSPEPTKYKNAECDAERMLGDIASQVAGKLLDGKKVWIETDGSKGAFGRDLARIRLDEGKWFSDFMIQRGLAVKWAGRTHDWCGNK